MTKNDGGPAFPHDNQELGTHHRIAQPGMSLRDWFAGQALLSKHLALAADAGGLADAAYALADAMLKAREK